MSSIVGGSKPGRRYQHQISRSCLWLIKAALFSGKATLCPLMEHHYLKVGCAAGCCVKTKTIVSSPLRPRATQHVKQHALRPFIGQNQVRVCGLPRFDQHCASFTKRHVCGLECFIVVRSDARLRHLHCPDMQDDPLFSVQRVLPFLNFMKTSLGPPVSMQRHPRPQTQRCTEPALRPQFPHWFTFQQPAFPLHQWISNRSTSGFSTAAATEPGVGSLRLVRHAGAWTCVSVNRSPSAPFPLLTSRGFRVSTRGLYL